MDLRELRVFVAVAELGSVTRAAAELHQSASSLSHTLSVLEVELGIELFHRLPRGMALTDAGEALLGPSRRTLHEAELAKGSVDLVRGVFTGTLTLAAVRGFTLLMAELMADFAAQYPGVVIRIRPPASEEEIVELVRGGSCELAFTRFPRLPSDLDFVEVAAERIVLAVPRDHRLAGRSSVEVAELADERVVGPLNPITRQMFVDFFRERGVEPQVVAEAATNEMVLELVCAGVGCTVTMESSVASITARGAAVVRIEGLRTSAWVLVTRKGQSLTPAAAALRGLAVGRFARRD